MASISVSVDSILSVDWVGAWLIEGGGRKAKETEKALTQFKMTAYISVNF